ncbi:hypothetical protein [Oceanibium sediminis]|uniref:hypothetical protein n=1 Tax=Oceanibium sediminis TaxID=2026339 RepID=UPI000DD3E56E|nr:hypothetical protein [Oceanibium sediminis]
MTRTTRITAAVLALTIAASGALAKGHDQGRSEQPGTDVFLETVAPAKTLGAGRGNSANTPAADNRQAGDK